MNLNFIKKYLILVYSQIFFFCPCFVTLAQLSPTIAWNQSFGGTSADEATIVLQTIDGGYIIGGTSASGLNGNKSQVSRGKTDFWIVKTDSVGSKIWDRTLGGSETEELKVLKQTADGGYILGGSSNSNISGDKTQASNGERDYWIVKLDKNGTTVWNKTIGGNKNDDLSAIIEIKNGGYLIGGGSSSDISGEKTEPTKGFEYLTDCWVVKIDSNGNKQWDRTYGGFDLDYIVSMEQTTDKGFILGAMSTSDISGDKSENKRSNSTFTYYDYWIVKIDSVGNKQWDKTIGSNEHDYLASIKQTSDGGFILGGYTSGGIGGDKSQNSTTGQLFDQDFWIVKLNSNGNKLWDKTIGGNGSDILCSLQETFNGGLVLGGWSNSNISGSKGQDSRGNNYDYWIIGLETDGNKVWDKTIGGILDDRLFSIDETMDKGFILAGYSYNGISIDKTSLSKGSSDYWLIKLNSTCNNLNAKFSNSCGSTRVIVNIEGIQNINNVSSWTLTYTLNGQTQSVIGTGTSFILAQNATLGTIYSLVNITSGTCSKNLNQTITIEPLLLAPNIISGNNCGPGTITLMASGAQSGNLYVWYDVANDGPALTSNLTGSFTTPVLTVTKTFYVAIKSSSGCESPRTPVTATIISVPVFAGFDETVCAESVPFQLTGFSPAGGNWGGAGVSSTGIFTPKKELSGTQTLTYTIVQNGCSFSATKQVIIPEPANLGDDISSCEGEEVVIKINNFPGSYLWSDGSAGTSLIVNNSGKFWVKVLQNGCISTDTIMVTFEPCLKPLFPNIITLNGDGINDTFKPQSFSGEIWQIEIYNRWGTKLFESKQYLNNWPDKKINDGPYFYLLKNSVTGEKHKGVLEVTH